VNNKSRSMSLFPKEFLLWIAVLTGLCGSLRADEQQDRSIYQLETKLTDQFGHEIGLDVFRGQPVLISMFYASCPMACPLLIHEIQRLESGLDPVTLSSTRVLLVSFDPTRDTPKALEALARERGVDQSRWRFATASEAQVRELAAVLGIKYRRLAAGGFDHTSVITLLNPKGGIEVRLEGQKQEDASWVSRLRALAAEQPSAPGTRPKAP